jgi:hypothetical protein
MAAIQKTLFEMLTTVKTHWFLTFLAFFVGRLLYKRYGSSLRSVPGPFIASVTPLWKLRQMYKGDFEKTHIALHRKYGILCLI